MAVVKIHQIKRTPAKALEYIADDAKTLNGAQLATNVPVLDVTDTNAVYQAMLASNAAAGAREYKGGVFAHHIIQSFDPRDAVSADLATQLGRELVEKFTGGDHDYYIATHTDKAHVHNHIIVNAVNFETGKKLRVQRNSLRQLRQMSDDLCTQNKLRVLEESPSRGRGIGELYLAARGESWKEPMRAALDKAASAATSWQEFCRAVYLQGYEVARRGETITYVDRSDGKRIRAARLGEAYREAAIMARISRAEVTYIDVHKSLLVAEGESVKRVRIPGTRGRQFLRVSDAQLIDSGAFYRIYLPTSGSHALTTRSGSLAGTVLTEKLFESFRRPTMDLATAKRTLGALDVDVNRLYSKRAAGVAVQSLQERIATKARWSKGAEGTPQDRARKHLQSLEQQLMVHAVVVSDALGDAESSAALISKLGAELRVLEREIDQTRADLATLSALRNREVQNVTRPPGEKPPSPTSEVRERLAERIERKKQERGQRNAAPAPTRGRKWQR